MTDPLNALMSLLHRLGVAGPARVCVFQGSSASKIGQGTGAPSSSAQRALALAAALMIAAAALALTTTPALAARGHVFEKSFGTEGSGPGQFKEPAGLAVNESNNLPANPQGEDIYVADKGNNRVELLNPKGEFQGQFNGSGTFPGEVNGAGEVTKAPEPLNLVGLGNAVAVDNACVQHKLAEPACKSFDPSNGDVYVTSGAFGSMVIDKFTATGAYIGQIAENSQGAPFEEVDGIAVDRNGRLWVTRTGVQEKGIESFSDAEVNVRLIPLFSPIAFAGANLDPGLAVDSEDNLYVHVKPESPPVLKVSPTGVSLNEKLDLESIVARDGVATELPSNDVYLDNVLRVERFASDGTLVETFGESQLAKGSCPEAECTDGVAVNSATGAVYVSEASSGVVLAFGLAPPAVPLVVSESVLGVTSESATLTAEVNPRGVPGESGTTTYRFEYGPCTGSSSTCLSSPYGFSTAAASLAPSFDVDPVSMHVQGLVAGTVYHYRVVAENKFSKAKGVPVEGSEQVFTTRGAGEFVLPDGREWELVSPPQKNGALIESLALSQVIQAAAGGGAISYATNTPSESEPPGYNLGAQVFSARGVGGGWSSGDLAPPHAVATGVGAGIGGEVRFFSEDLSAEVVQPFGAFDSSISQEASEQTAFLHSDYASGASGELCVSSCFRPFVTGNAGYANVPEPGTVFGQTDATTGQSCSIICGPLFVGATPDLSHVVLQSAVALTAGGGAGLYEWSAGAPASQQLQPLPGKQLGLEQTADGAGGDAARNAISSDGSRVFTSTDPHLSMTDPFTHRTVAVDTPEPGCASEGCGEGAAGAEFQGATSDGKRLLFSDSQKLMAQGFAYARQRSLPGGGADLYECEVLGSAGEPACSLHDLAPAGSQLGSVLGFSEDASWVYFVANGVLENGTTPVPGAVSGTCPNRRAGGFEHTTCNLYVRHGGVTSLVAVLSGGDAPDWDIETGRLTARVSPDGQWLAFMSQRSLTGYDNRDALSGRPDEEVFLYDGVSGRLVCASCDPTGARPHGVEYGSTGDNLPLAGGVGVWLQSSWLAANVPAWTSYEQASAIYQSRYLSNSGRLFFNASDGLVPKDVNGTEDVYQYEPQGVPAGEHACTSASGNGSEVFKAARPFNEIEREGKKIEGEEGAGCVALISSGASAKESAFLDASASGGDVFFLTSSRLAPQDFDDALDVYDAHECTSESPCPAVPAAAPPACNTEASCDPAPSLQPQIFGLSGSATFSGPENLTPPAAKVSKKAVKCSKGKVRNKHGKCLKKSRSKRHKAKRPVHTNRRAG
jgi:WD40-like Beta Propeller Repeat